MGELFCGYPQLDSSGILNILEFEQKILKNLVLIKKVYAHPHTHTQTHTHKHTDTQRTPTHLRYSKNSKRCNGATRELPNEGHHPGQIDSIPQKKLNRGGKLTGVLHYNNQHRTRQHRRCQIRACKESCNNELTVRTTEKFERDLTLHRGGTNCV